MDKKWNLQDIRPAESRRRRSAPDRPVEQRPPHRPVTEEDDGTVSIGIEDGKKKKRTSLVLAMVVFLLVLGGGFAASYLMGGAEVTVFPRHREPNVNAAFTAHRAPDVGELSYEIMSLEADGERQVRATGREEVTEQATGEIVIYNNTDGAERLIKNSRFETPNGLIFKITESAVVPAAGTDEAGDAVPGTIRAEVFADGPGEQYNIETGIRLTIPGYAEGGYDQLFENIYAETPEPITGGFDGERFIIDEDELRTAQQELRTELRNALLERIPEEKPAGFVIYDEAVSVTFESLPAVEYGEDLATIKERAFLQIPIFAEGDFAQYIAAATVPGYENEPVRIDDPQALTFSYASATTSVSDISTLDRIDFELAGRPLIVWEFDEGRLKTDLMDAAKTALPTVLGGYPSIEKAEAVVRPFWKRSFPDDLEDIEIIERIDDTE